MSFQSCENVVHDSTPVCVSSQNWPGRGITKNRQQKNEGACLRYINPGAAEAVMPAKVVQGSYRGRKLCPTMLHSLNTWQKGEAGRKHLGEVSEDAKEPRKWMGWIPRHRRGWFTTSWITNFKGFSVILKAGTFFLWQDQVKEHALIFCKCWETEGHCNISSYYLQSFAVWNIILCILHRMLGYQDYAKDSLAWSSSLFPLPNS